MKIIFSRKGFDSVSGGCPSPIFPDGRIISFPILGDETNSSFRVKDLNFSEYDLSGIVKDLTHDRHDGNTWIHLDPDLSSSALKRNSGWLPCFGQCSAAQSHLDNMSISNGDLFLFFGWFRKVEFHHSRWRYIPGSPNLHVIFGWLSIGDIMRTDRIIHNPPQWCSYHTHVHFSSHPHYHYNNTLYVASEYLTLKGFPYIPGGGVFHTIDPRLVLSDPNQGRSTWILPKWFYPSSGRKPLSYHRNMKRWKLLNGNAVLQVVGRGQEFVLDCSDYSETLSWIGNLMACAS